MEEFIVKGKRVGGKRVLFFGKLCKIVGFFAKGFGEVFSNKGGVVLTKSADHLIIDGRNFCLSFKFGKGFHLLEKSFCDMLFKKRLCFTLAVILELGKGVVINLKGFFIPLECEEAITLKIHPFGTFCICLSHVKGFFGTKKSRFILL